jgi:hypothetical protein
MLESGLPGFWPGKPKSELFAAESSVTIASALGQRHAMFAARFHPFNWDRPEARIEIKFRLLGVQDFACPRHRENREF